MVRLRAVGAAGIVSLLALALIPALSADASSFRGFNYPSPDCTPMRGTAQFGLAPQQWNSSVGLPLTPTGSPAAQRIVIGEINQTANATAVNDLLRQCGLPTVSLPVANSTLYPPTSTAPGLEATLDASVVAAALPPNASITMVNTGALGPLPFYAMLTTAATACGFVFAGDPNTTLVPISKGPGFPAGGCIISISYGGAELRAQENDADFMLQQLADQGVIVLVSAGDEGSGGCIANTGLNFGNATTTAVAAVALTSGVVTVETSGPTGYAVGDHVYLTFQIPGVASFTSTVTVTATTTSPPTFSFNYAGTNLPPTAATGLTSNSFGTITPQYPASNPNVLAVGGTQWQTPSQGQAQGIDIPYSPSPTHTDYVWHDSNPNPNCANVASFPVSGAQGTGGGQSTLYPMPAYQTAAAGANYTVAGAGRMIPDVAALAGWPLYALANPGLPVTAKQQSGTTATLTTTSSYGMDPGEDFTVAGVGAPFDGTFPIVSTTATTISYTVATSATVPLLPVSPTGTMTQTCVSIPCPATQFPWTQVYGTSAATPLVAVGIANVNAVLSARGLSSIDNSGGSMDAHTIFYDPRNASAMTDVTVGDNDIFNLGGWAALTGYDMTTGMGVPNFATLASLLIQRLAPTPTPTPTSTGTTPTTVPTTAPTPTPAPSAQPTSPAIPTPRPTTTAQPRDPGGANPERTIVAGPGVVVLSAATAQLVTPRTMIDTPAIRVRNAPTVDAQPSAPISLVARGLRPGTAYTIRIAGTDSKAVLGGTTADSKGLAQLPVFLLNKAGSYTIEIVDRQTKLVTFVKLAVKKRR